MSPTRKPHQPTTAQHKLTLLITNTDDARSAGADDALLMLPSTPAAAGEARRHVRASVSADGWSPDDLDVAVLLTSELVTNAVQHGAAPIALQLRNDGDGLRVEVRDAGAALRPKRSRGQDLTAERGRGLALVEALASSWGSTVHGDLLIGKTVWFEIRPSAAPQMIVG